MNRYALISAVTHPVSLAEAQAYRELEALSSRWRLPSPMRELATAPAPATLQLRGPLADWLGGIIARAAGAKL